MATNTLWVSQYGAQVEYVDGQDELKSVKVSQYGAQVEHVGGGGETPQIKVSQYGAQAEHVGGLDTLQALKFSQYGAQVEYKETFPGSSLAEYKPRILVEFLWGDYQFSSEDLYINDAGDFKFYQRRLLKNPIIEKYMPNTTHGRETFRDVTIELDNSDGYFTTLLASTDIRNQLIRIRRYEPQEPIGTDVLLLEMAGVIKSYRLTFDKLELSISESDAEVMQKLIPPRVYKTTDWTTGVNGTTITNPPDDLGKAYPICFGYCYKVPCRYVLRNTVSDYYDYIISHGTLESCTAVYRDSILVNSSEYTFYDGSQGSPYPSFAFLRFTVEQRDFNGAMHQISADVHGMELGGTAAERNFSTCIKHLLQDATWGLAQGVNANTFTTAYTDISTHYCDGFIAEQQRAIDITDKLLLACRGRLARNEDAEWTLRIDKSVSAVSQYFGFDDGYYDNIKTIDCWYKTPISDATKTIELNYRWNDWEAKNMMKLSREVLSFGETMTVDNEFVYVHETADRITCYIEQKLEMNDTRLDITVGMEGRLLQLLDTVSIRIPTFNITEDYQIVGIRRDINEFTLTLCKYASSIYTYNAASLPNDDVAPNLPDYTNEQSNVYTAPTAPTGFEFVSSYVVVAGDGSAWVYATAKAIAPDKKTNFQKIVFGYREVNAAEYTWIPGTLYDSNTREWRASGCAPASGRVTKIYYDCVAKSVNMYGRESTWGAGSNSTLNTMAPCDTANPLPITGVSGYGFGKTWYYSWTPSTARDIHQYRIQVGSSNFSTIYATAYVGSNNYAYTNEALPYGELCARVVAVDRSENESSVWSNVATALTITMLATDISTAAITSTLLADGSINSSKIGATAIIAGKVNSCAITASCIGNDAVSSVHILASAVDGAAIQTGAVSEAKINFGTSVSTNALPATPSGYVTIDGKKFYYYAP